MSLKVDVAKKSENVYVVKTFGSIDTTTYVEFEKVLNNLISQTTKALILDMEYVDYISSLGLSVIFKAKSALSKNNAKLLIVNLKPQIKKIFEIIKTIPESLFETMQEADEYLDKFLDNLINEEDNRK